MKIIIEQNGWQKVMWVAITIVGAALVSWLLSFALGKVFKVAKRKHNGLHLTFFEHLGRVIIVVGIFMIAISALDGSSSVWKTMLGGTAVVSAVVAFAAQDVVKDIIAGLMISLQKPFDIGDRIALSDGTVGIVEDMTNRHVVLIGLDTTRHIVPNSVINSLKITNYSFHRDCRSANFQFPIGYDSDVDFAKAVILKAIMDDPLTIPGKLDKNGEPCYAGIYFTAFESSSLIMQTTVYYESTVSSEVLIDEINTKVRAALNENGIEIPYDYVTVINKAD